MTAPVNAPEPTPHAGILKIAPYTPGRSRIEGCEKPIKLSSNESSFGPSPATLAAYHAAAASLNRYPDGAQTALREAIAEVHGLDVARIVCGNGSDELLQLVIRSFAVPGDEVLLSENGFLMCDIHAMAQGAVVIKAPEPRDRVDVDALLARVTPRTRVLCIANPNNPTGTYIPYSEVLRLHGALPGNVVLVLDGAYAEYATAADYDAGARLVESARNVVMTRSFSKIYGLPALRIGWAYCPPRVLDAIQRIRTPFSTNGAALAAATAAVRDQAWVTRIRAFNAEWLLRIADRLRALGLEVVPSMANFYLLRFPAGCGRNSHEAAAFLIRNGIIPRPVSSHEDGQELRITVGTEEENRAVLEVMTRYMRGETAAP
jgi:histidinol-phosphate aminotransferase